MEQKSNEMVIDKEKAVFWLDGQGYWRNEAGRFKNKKIIDHFHASIGKDDGGYFVSQDKAGVTEKVYFPYAETALFIFDVVCNDEITCILNTGKKISLEPENLFIQNDSLYLQTPDDLIKFTERAMMKISPLLEETKDTLALRVGSELYPIPEING